MKRLSGILFFIVLLSLGVDLYAYQGVRVLAALTGVAAGISIAYWLVSAGVLISFLVGFGVFFRKKRHMNLLSAIFNLFLTLFVTKLTFILFLFGEDLIRLALAGVSLIGGQGIFPARTPVASTVGGAAALLPFFALIFGVTRGKYHYKVHRTTVYFDDLPEAFDGFKLVQVRHSFGQPG